MRHRLRLDTVSCNAAPLREESMLCFSGSRRILTNIGALIIIVRIGFWGPLYYASIRNPPKIMYG